MTSSSESGRMTLAEWRKERGLTQRETASRLSAILGRVVHPPSIAQWETGVMPGADVAEAIRELTDGQVTGLSFGRHASQTENETKD